MLIIKLLPIQVLSVFQLLFAHYPYAGTNSPNSERTTPLKSAFVIFLMYRKNKVSAKVSDWKRGLWTRIFMLVEDPANRHSSDYKVNI